MALRNIYDYMYHFLQHMDRNQMSKRQNRKTTLKVTAKIASKNKACHNALTYNINYKPLLYLQNVYFLIGQICISGAMTDTEKEPGKWAFGHLLCNIMQKVHGPVNGTHT